MDINFTEVFDNIDFDGYENVRVYCNKMKIFSDEIDVTEHNPIKMIIQEDTNLFTYFYNNINFCDIKKEIDRLFLDYYTYDSIYDLEEYLNEIKKRTTKQDNLKNYKYFTYEFLNSKNSDHKLICNFSFKNYDEYNYFYFQQNWQLFGDIFNLFTKDSQGFKNTNKNI